MTKFKVKIVYPLMNENELKIANYLIENELNDKTAFIRSGIDDRYCFDTGCGTHVDWNGAVPRHWIIPIEEKERPLTDIELFYGLLTRTESLLGISYTVTSSLYQLIRETQQNERLKMRPKQTFREWRRRFDPPMSREIVWNAALESCGIAPKEEE